MVRKQDKKTESATAFSLDKSNFYNEFAAEREEILRHKWIESEKVGRDIGFERALLDWVMNYRDKWRASRRTGVRKPFEK